MGAVEKTYLYFPPPARRPHLINNPTPLVSFWTAVNPLRCVCHVVFEGRIADEFLDTLDRIPAPELKLLGHHLVILIKTVADYGDNIARPLWACGKGIDLLEERAVVVER